MVIYPDKSSFNDFFGRFTRVPLYGEVSFPGLNPARLYHELFANSQESFIFESGQRSQATARYSFLGRSNKKSIQVTQNLIWYHNNGFFDSIQYTTPTCFERMDFEPALDKVDYLPHFWGGWVGYLAYEMSRRFENFSFPIKDNLNLPDLNFFQVDRLFVYDHFSQVLRYIISDKTGRNAETYYQGGVEEIQKMASSINRLGNILRKPLENLPDSGRNGSWLQSNLTLSEYIDMVESAKRYIETGDIYQANLAQRFETNYQKDSFDLYLKLRKVNPSPFSGYLRFKDFSIVSSSPERLIKLKGNFLETRPIAGTRPRGITVEEDQKLDSELLINQKEGAEHLMLVDLERNDLGRICEYGSVRVTDLMFLEKYSHVTHIVSNIVGKIRDKVQLADIIQAVFPGGTITGCPKIRGMEIIEELEPANRGPYSGSFGYIGFNRIMDLNIIIRTIIVNEGKAYFHVGAGIVADSIPEKEYQETLDKAAAMKQALFL